MNYDYAVFFDGGHTNGRLAVGAVVCDPNWDVVFEFAKFAGEGTSNVAEYRALAHAICMAKLAGARRPMFLGDSLLVVRQVNGYWAQKGDTESPLVVEHSRCTAGLMRFDRWMLRHVPRERNKRADWIVSTLLGHDRALKKAPPVASVEVDEEATGKPGWSQLPSSRKRAA